MSRGGNLLLDIGPTADGRIPEIMEFNIGHFLVGEAIFTGLEAAVARMRAIILAARAGQDAPRPD